MTSWTSRATASVALAALLSTLGACSGDGGGDDDEPPAPDSTNSPSDTDVTAGQTISPPDLPVPPTLKNEKGAVADISYDACATESGDQRVSGTVQNSSRSRTDYVITFNWINDGFDVLGRGVAVVRDVPAGKSKRWDLSAKVSDGATQCAPNVKRGQLKKS